MQLSTTRPRKLSILSPRSRPRRLCSIKWTRSNIRFPCLPPLLWSTFRTNCLCRSLDITWESPSGPVWSFLTPSPLLGRSSSRRMPRPGNNLSVSVFVYIYHAHSCPGGRDFSFQRKERWCPTTSSPILDLFWSRDHGNLNSIAQPLKTVVHGMSFNQHRNGSTSGVGGYLWSRTICWTWNRYECLPV